MTDQEYALRCREACRPEKCNHAAACWVVLGTSRSLLTNGGSGGGSIPRCKACLGKVREWLRSQAGLPA